jgi:hypothetical protein
MDTVFNQIARFAWPLVVGLRVMGAALLYVKVTHGAFLLMLAGLLIMSISEGLLKAEETSHGRMPQPA